MSKDDARYELVVTVTGAAGFIGTNLIRRLLRENMRIRIFAVDHPSANTKRFVDMLGSLTEQEERRVSYEPWDVLQPLHSDLLAVDAIYHLAGIANPQVYLERPIDVMDLNIMGLRNILDRIVRWSDHRPRIVFTSTSEVYGKNAATPFKETDDSVFGSSDVPRWCYAASKYLAEHYLKAFGRSQGIKYSIFRLFNVVGPGIDTPGGGRVITKMVGDAINYGEIKITAPGLQVRCLTHVEDAVEALAKIAFRKAWRDDPNWSRWKEENHTLNLGGNDPINMRQLAEKIRNHLLEQNVMDDIRLSLVLPEVIYGQGYEDMMYRIPDIKAIREELGWEPTWSTDDIIRQLVDHTAAQLI